MRKVSLLTLIVAWAGLLGCEIQSTPVPIEQPDPGVTESGLIGPSGASLNLAGVTFEVPEGAVVEETEITVTVLDSAPPDAFSAYSRVYHFEPAGQVFEEPVTVTLPFSGTPQRATIFWTAHESAAYVALETEVVGHTAVARVNHFSDAFVGSGCEGDDCCDSANGELDVVLVVDNSNSMQEEQESLAAQLPRMARVFATGDLDGDGEQDFPALQSVRVGVVTSDMGTGSYTIMTCNGPINGDDGVLREEGNSEIEGCAESYPSFAELSADDGPEALENFVRHVECVGVAGTGGCGFEQQLEATLKSVTPSSSDIDFADGNPGQGDRENAGFLREDSIVAFIVLTDEEDCSTPNDEMFNPTRDDFGPLNVRCVVNEDELYSVSRYASGLRDIREDADDVIFGLVAGVPADLVADPDAIDFDAILLDERMAHRVSPDNPNELLPSCETASGTAYPPRRLVETARSFGGNGIVQSICQSDFTPVVGAILERVAARARGECL